MKEDVRRQGTGGESFGLGVDGLSEVDDITCVAEEHHDVGDSGDGDVVALDVELVGGDIFGMLGGGGVGANGGLCGYQTAGGGPGTLHLTSISTTTNNNTIKRPNDQTPWQDRVGRCRPPLTLQPTTTTYSLPTRSERSTVGRPTPTVKFVDNKE